MAGVWTGAGVSKHKPSRTLFVTCLPVGAEVADVEALFKGEPGFMGARGSRRCLHIDFDSERLSTAAMRKHQGHKFNAGDARGLGLDFDRASARVRNQQLEMHRKSMGKDSGALRYYCANCKVKCLMLDKIKHLKDMPRRSTDQAFCVNEAKYLRAVNMVVGPIRILQRPKGKEKQHQLMCTLCGAFLAYRPAPVGTDTKFMYIPAGVMAADAGGRHVLGSPGLDVGPSAGAGAVAAGARKPAALVAAPGEAAADGEATTTPGAEVDVDTVADAEAAPSKKRRLAEPSEDPETPSKAIATPM